MISRRDENRRRDCRYCCTGGGVGTVLMYSWLMDGKMCVLIMKKGLEKKSRYPADIHIYTKARRRGAIANGALQMTGHEQADPLTHGFVNHWVKRRELS